MFKDKKFTIDKTPNFEKTQKFGFTKCEKGYSLTLDLLDGDFSLNLLISLEGELFYEVIDKDLNEEYYLAYDESSEGAFVGKIRAEVSEKLGYVAVNCFEESVPMSEYERKIASYIDENYGAKPEFLWEDTPDCFIFRIKSNNKWFAVVMEVKKTKLGIDEDGVVKIMNLKETAESISSLVDGKNYFLGYHMNKKHWYTVRLDGSVSLDEIFKRIDKSYSIISIKR